MNYMSDERMSKITRGLVLLIEDIKSKKQSRNISQQDKEKSWYDLPDFFSVSQLVEVMNIPRYKVYMLCKQNGFPAEKIGNRIIISKRGLCRWLTDRVYCPFDV